MSGQTFSPRLFDEDDEAEDIAYKQIINQVIQQITPPTQAAAEIDEWVTREANARFFRLKDRKLTTEERESIYLIGPNPSRHVSMIMGCIARVCSGYPRDHSVQNALVAFIQALNDLPKHRVPSLSYDDLHQPLLDQAYSLWPFGTPSAEHLAQKFQMEAEDVAYPFSDVETPGSESQLRWRNLQAFISRLTMLNLVDCSNVSALMHILPSSHVYPNLDERRKCGPNRIAGDLVAASQWLVEEQTRGWVYRQCKTDTSQVWNMENWKQWRAQMLFIAGDGRFGEETRSLARLLGNGMDIQANNNH